VLGPSRRLTTLPVTFASTDGEVAVGRSVAVAWRVAVGEEVEVGDERSVLAAVGRAIGGTGLGVGLDGRAVGLGVGLLGSGELVGGLDVGDRGTAAVAKGEAGGGAPGALCARRR